MQFEIWYFAEVWKTVTAAERAADPLVDDLIRDESLAYLDQFKVDIDNNVYDNFFLAVGFRKPHLPWVFPEEYLNDYPGDVELPQAIEREIPHDFPPIARDM